MKIDSNSIPKANLSGSSVAKVADKNAVAAPKPNTEIRQTQQTSQKRITKWFSQAGVGLTHTHLKSASVNEKVALRKTMSAQRKLKNLENILGRALDFCLDDGKDETLDPDWFFSFVNMAEDIYSPAMQELWGKIFAVETARPGSFSLKTLGLLKQLTQKDAQIFRHAVSLTSKRKGESTPKILIGYYQKPSVWSFFSSLKEHKLNLGEHGLGYPDVLSLMDLGLIHHSEIESAEIPINIGAEWRCAGQNLTLSARRPGTTLIYYKFTTTGAELCKLVTRQKQDNYVKALSINLQSAYNLS
jgi:uncharacterized repeat protein (TIGR03899 family)